VPNGVEHIQRLQTLLPKAANYVKACIDEGLSRETIIARYGEWLYENAGPDMDALARDQYSKANSAEMGVDGLMRYWKKKTNT
jgi:hypothetical protein